MLPKDKKKIYIYIYTYTHVRTCRCVHVNPVRQGQKLIFQASGLKVLKSSKTSKKNCNKCICKSCKIDPKRLLNLSGCKRAYISRIFTNASTDINNSISKTIREYMAHLKERKEGRKESHTLMYRTLETIKNAFRKICFNSNERKQNRKVPLTQ